MKHLRFRDNKMYIDQTECIENTPPLPQRNQYTYFAKAYGREKPFEGERAWFLSAGEESEA
jgi:hypothetical protein